MRFSNHRRCRMMAILRATETTAFMMGERLAMRSPSVLSAVHFYAHMSRLAVRSQGDDRTSLSTHFVVFPSLSMVSDWCPLRVSPKCEWSARRLSDCPRAWRRIRSQPWCRSSCCPVEDPFAADYMLIVAGWSWSPPTERSSAPQRRAGTKWRTHAARADWH